MLIYLHGFNSSPQSNKARQLDQCLAERGLSGRYICPALPHQPSAAITEVERRLTELAGPFCFIGSSLGGFYATYLAEKHDARAILINPAIDPHIGLRPLLGEQENLHTHERYRLTERHLDEWRRFCVEKIEPQRYLVLLETGDEVLDYRTALSRYAGACQIVIEGGDHSLQSFPQHLGLIMHFAGLSEP